MAKAKDITDEAKAKAHLDYMLITACVEYGFTMGAANIAYRIDPTDATFAAGMDSERLARGCELLAEAAKLQPITLDGLAAKAATAAMICEPTVLDHISKDEASFIRSLALDVRCFHELAGGKIEGSTTDKPFGSKAQ